MLPAKILDFSTCTTAANGCHFKLPQNDNCVHSKGKGGKYVNFTECEKTYKTTADDSLPSFTWFPTSNSSPLTMALLNFCALYPTTIGRQAWLEFFQKAWKSISRDQRESLVNSIEIFMRREFHSKSSPICLLSKMLHQQKQPPEASNVPSGGDCKNHGDTEIIRWGEYLVDDPLNYVEDFCDTSADHVDTFGTLETSEIGLMHPSPFFSLWNSPKTSLASPNVTNDFAVLQPTSSPLANLSAVGPGAQSGNAQSVISLVLESLSFLDPLPKLPPSLVAFIGTRYNAWHSASHLLLLQKTSFGDALPRNNFDESHEDSQMQTVHCRSSTTVAETRRACVTAEETSNYLVTLYSSICENDYVAGVRRLMSSSTETQTALNLEQKGEWELAMFAIDKALELPAGFSTQSQKLSVNSVVKKEHFKTSADANFTKMADAGDVKPFVGPLMDDAAEKTTRPPCHDICDSMACIDLWVEAARQLTRWTGLVDAAKARNRSTFSAKDVSNSSKLTKEETQDVGRNGDATDERVGGSSPTHSLLREGASEPRSQQKSEFEANDNNLSECNMIESIESHFCQNNDSYRYSDELRTNLYQTLSTVIALLSRSHSADVKTDARDPGSGVSSNLILHGSFRGPGDSTDVPPKFHSLKDVENSLSQLSNLFLLHWRCKPLIIGGQTHSPSLVDIQTFAEACQAVDFIRNILHAVQIPVTSAQRMHQPKGLSIFSPPTRTPKHELVSIPDPRELFASWRYRIPDKSEPLALWMSVITGRSLSFEAVWQALRGVVPPGVRLIGPTNNVSQDSSGSGYQKHFSDEFWTLTKFASAVRNPNGMPGVAFQILSKLRKFALQFPSSVSTTDNIFSLLETAKIFFEVGDGNRTSANSLGRLNLDCSKDVAEHFTTDKKSHQSGSLPSRGVGDTTGSNPSGLKIGLDILDSIDAGNEAQENQEGDLFAKSNSGILLSMKAKALLTSHSVQQRNGLFEVKTGMSKSKRRILSEEEDISAAAPTDAKQGLPEVQSLAASAICMSPFLGDPWEVSARCSDLYIDKLLMSLAGKAADAQQSDSQLQNSICTGNASMPSVENVGLCDKLNDEAEALTDSVIDHSATSIMCHLMSIHLR